MSEPAEMNLGTGSKLLRTYARLMKPKNLGWTAWRMRLLHCRMMFQVITTGLVFVTMIFSTATS